MRTTAQVALTMLLLGEQGALMPLEVNTALPAPERY